MVCICLQEVESWEMDPNSFFIPGLEICSHKLFIALHTVLYILLSGIAAGRDIWVQVEKAAPQFVPKVKAEL